MKTNAASATFPWRLRICRALIATAVILTWCNSLSAPFQFDDYESILGNPSIRELALPSSLVPPATGGETVSGRPILNLSFALNYALGKFDVRGYRAVNVLVHAFGALVLFEIVRRTRVAASERSDGTKSSAGDTWPWLALAASLFWALHPLQTAAVTYVAQRAESLAGLFYLLTLYGFIRSSASQRSAGRWAAASVLACAFGMATKETVVSAPLVVLLYDRVFLAGSLRLAWRMRWRTHVAWAATWIVVASLVVSNPSRGGSAGFGAEIGSWTYFLTQCEAITHYLTLIFWPAAQVFDHGVPTVTDVTAVIPQLLFLCAIGFGTAWALWRNRATGFLGACFFLALAPSSSFIPVATQTIAEHRMYLALAAVLVLVCVSGQHVLRFQRTWLIGAIITTITGALAFATFTRNRVYQSELLLWQDTVTKRPENARAHNNLGRALLKIDRLDDAIEEFRRAIALQPNHAFAHFNLGVTFLSRDQWKQAEPHFRAALAADPRYVDARTNLGRVLSHLGRKEEAIAQYRIAIDADPHAAEVRIDLAALLLEQGNSREAEIMLRAVLATAPGSAEAHYHLGLLFEKSDALDVAETEYRAALRLNPQFGAAHLALGNALVRRNEIQAADAAIQAAIRLNPKSAAVHYALGNLLVKKQLVVEAMNAYRQALTIDPAHVQARNNLANCQLVSGDLEHAIGNYEEVLRVRPGDETVRRNLEIAWELRRGRATGRSQ
jgi:protein O-mannosyl-transferase